MNDRPPKKSREPTYAEVLDYANLLNGSDHKKFGEFEPIEIELAFKDLFRRSSHWHGG